MRRLSKCKKGKVIQTTAAPFLIILTLVFVFYVILLQPEDRAELLEGSGGNIVAPNTNPGGNPDSNSVDRNGISTRPGTLSLERFVFEGPGRLSEQNKEMYEHDLSPFYFRGEATARSYISSNEFYVSASLFSRKDKVIQFALSDPNAVREMIMTFAAPLRNGILQITLNEKELFSGYVSAFNVGPIKIATEDLETQNTLKFSVDSPGMAFWEKNQLQISQLSITGAEIDLDALTAQQIIDLRPIEIHQLQSARLRFEPGCTPGAAEQLTVKVNGEEVYRSIPDCGVINLVSLPEDLLKEGQNGIYFETTGGSYLVDQIQVRTDLEDDDGVSYYFTLDEDDYFNSFIESEPICGEVDNVCPSECSEDLDKDCCFVEYTQGYWCDVPTHLSSDRCVGRVSSFNSDRCLSGYEDEAGSPHDDFEDVCGDDTDGVCPAGCSRFYDEDCCLSDGSDRYWCEDLPTGGVANICLGQLSNDQAVFCPEGYLAEDGSAPSGYESRRHETEEINLKEEYEVIAEFYFVDDEVRHKAEININGYKRTFDTRKAYYDLDISEFVRDNNNYLQIIPESDFSLLEVRVLLKRR